MTARDDLKDEKVAQVGEFSSTTTLFEEELEVVIRARYPLIGVQTCEEERAVEILRGVALRLGKRIFGWSVSKGLLPLDIESQKQRLDSRSLDPQMILLQIQELVDPSVFVFFDFHPYMKDATIIRMLREVVQDFKRSLKTLILLSPQLTIPLDLEKEIILIPLDLPGPHDLRKLLNHVIDQLNNRGDLVIRLSEDTKERLIQSTLGLTLSEAENVLARAVVLQGGLSLDSLNLIISEKEQIIRRSGVLEFYSTIENMAQIGGLDNLKDWLRKRGKSFSKKAREFGLPAPKGILLIGVQGCGKSLTAKAIASYWGMPLLKLDVGSLFSSLVGSTEKNLRRALNTAESVAPAILWVDEIEKGFAGLASSGKLDGGVSARVFGGLITWLQEKTSPVFVIATANDISQLPPEMIRKGRFDEIFFIDLPTINERRQIFQIHLMKRHFNPEDFEVNHLTAISAGYSGAEIESSIVSALFDVFDREEQLRTDHIEVALKDTVPLSKLMAEKLTELRQWAEGRVRMASQPDQRLAKEEAK